MNISANARQPARLPWAMDRLLLERSILMGMAIDLTTASSYNSAVNSYLTFCKLHAIPPEPSPDTFSLYVTWQSAHIDPKSVDSYLSGICNNLEPFYPEIRQVRKSLMVSRTLKGAKRRHGRAVKRNHRSCCHIWLGSATILVDLARTMTNYSWPWLIVVSRGSTASARFQTLTTGSFETLQKPFGARQW